NATRAQVVLQRDRHTGERAGVVAGAHGVVDRLGGGTRFIDQEEVEGVDVALALDDARQVLLEDLDRRPFAGAHARRDLARRHGASPSTGGTRKRCSSTDGAAASTSSR